MKQNTPIRSALRSAFPKTLPVMAGYLFLGFSYGLYMHAEGFPFYYPMLMAWLIYGGSLEFVAVSMLTSPFAPLSNFILAFLIQARHLFYGLAMLERYKGLGWKKYYLIFAMSDETFAVNSSAAIPPGIDEGWFMVFVSFLDRMYWICGAGAGALFGSLLPIPTEGLSFVMTAMFAAIFMDRFFRERRRIASCIGLAASLICLFFFGPDRFMIPAMLAIILLLWGTFQKGVDAA